ncbi:hypothetical protein M405DRAFT_847881 [Rhizopogon salebrosus TDB-379]|nr:hypothetical protein M405DRAFT_847881 [Rhizopogon salebrosus TDB-379]
MLSCTSNIAFAFSSISSLALILGLSWWWLGVLVTGWHSFPSLLFKFFMLLIPLATSPPPPLSGALSLILLLLSGSPFLLVLLLSSLLPNLEATGLQPVFLFQENQKDWTGPQKTGCNRSYTQPVAL